MKKLITIVILLFLIGCSESPTSKTSKFECHIIDINHEPLERVEIYYDQIKLNSTDEEGLASVSLSLNHTFQISLLKFQKEGFQFHILETTAENDTPRYFVMGMDEKEPSNWFDFLYQVSGKVVLHQDGETRIKDAQLIINDKRCIEVGDSGNYEIKYVYQNLTIRVEHQEYDFVDTTHQLKNTHVVTESISGLTFRGVPR